MPGQCQSGGSRFPLPEGVTSPIVFEILLRGYSEHHPDISRRVIATESADLSAVTEPEIEALAKRHMIAVV